MELRKDYLLEHWVILSEGRGSRPRDFGERVVVNEQAACFFCPGKEGQTPDEIGRFPKSGDWKIRWFPNKFPAVEKDEKSALQQRGFLASAGAYGHHEIIVETPDHRLQLFDLSEGEVLELLSVYANRLFWLRKDPQVQYVTVFKNHGRNAGTSLLHSHTQVIASHHVPEAVREEAAAAGNAKGCAYCAIVASEMRSERRCFENSSFAAFAPYASRFNYECWIFPKRHVKSLLGLEQHELAELAAILLQVLRKLKALGADYNFFLHEAPPQSELHFHIEVAPRIATWGGFELATGIVINSVHPELAAAWYRS